MWSASFVQNQAVDGGAICAQSSDSFLVTNNNRCNFSQNIAFGTGGAIFLESFERVSKLYIYNYIFTENSAHQTGGAISVEMESDIYFQGITCIYNKAGDQGGAIFSRDTTISLFKSKIQANQAGSNIATNDKLQSLEKNTALRFRGRGCGGISFISTIKQQQLITHENCFYRNKMTNGITRVIGYDQGKNGGNDIMIEDKVFWHSFKDVVEDPETACVYIGDPINYQKKIEQLTKLTQDNCDTAGINAGNGSVVQILDTTFASPSNKGNGVTTSVADPTLYTYVATPITRRPFPTTSSYVPNIRTRSYTHSPNPTLVETLTPTSIETNVTVFNPSYIAVLPGESTTVFSTTYVPSSTFTSTTINDTPTDTYILTNVPTLTDSTYINIGTAQTVITGSTTTFTSSVTSTMSITLTHTAIDYYHTPRPTRSPNPTPRTPIPVVPIRSPSPHRPGTDSTDTKYTITLSGTNTETITNTTSYAFSETYTTTSHGGTTINVSFSTYITITVETYASTTTYIEVLTFKSGVPTTQTQVLTETYTLSDTMSYKETLSKTTTSTIISLTETNLTTLTITIVKYSTKTYVSTNILTNVVIYDVSYGEKLKIIIICCVIVALVIIASIIAVVLYKKVYQEGSSDDSTTSLEDTKQIEANEVLNISELEEHSVEEHTNDDLTIDVSEMAKVEEDMKYMNAEF